MDAQDRKIIERNPGVSRKKMRRMLSPSFGGELVKPFVLLDYFNEDMKKDDDGFPFHSHSGIATMSYLFEGEIQYEDSVGSKGILPPESIEWVVSGGGAWHRVEYNGDGKIHGIQIWIALLPHIEDGEPTGQYVSREDIPVVGPARILLGELAGKVSPVNATSPMNFFDVQLKAGESWDYEPPADQKVAWIFVHQGKIEVSGETAENEFVIFEESNEGITVEAREDARFFFGSAVKHDYPLVVAHDTIHTNQESLDKATKRKEEIGKQLHEKGKI